ncbi:hypothetical protein JW926_17010 [Candidatus Sumerlaeota bacterium]|nr:hypothetical protein [Candidatus Sumerlaeota bacterium]
MKRYFGIIILFFTSGYAYCNSDGNQGNDSAKEQQSHKSEWKIGAPIVTYWSGPGSNKPLGGKEAAQVCAGGWNLAWAQNKNDLDELRRHGIRGMLVIGTPDIQDAAQAKNLAALIEKVSAHPALYAYHLVDEPGTGAFPKLARLVAFLRQRDPAHTAYINLFPTYANEAQLGVSDDAAERARVGYPQDFAGVNTDDKTAMRYREYLRQFIDIVKPDLISYDHYHFLKNSDGIQYFLNLSLIRKAALDANLPFLNIIQACDSPAEGWRGPNENEVRWLTFTSLAYGAQGISHFRYDIGLWENATTPRPLYWEVARINRDFLAMATQLQPLTSLGAYHCGKAPLGGEALPPDSPFSPDPFSQEILLGYFGKEENKPTHVVVVNLDYKNAVSITLKGPAPMDLYHAPTRTWRADKGGSRVKLDIQPGGGALARLRE